MSALPEDQMGEEPSQTINFQPSFVLVAIDTHSSMFELRKESDEEGGEKTHSFKDVLSACYQVADSLIFSNNRSNYNQFGVVLVENDPKKASLVEIESNLLDTIKTLKKESEKSSTDLTKHYKRTADIDLGAFFLMCKKKFNQINSAYYKRTIIFITNDDNPVGDNPQLRFTAMNEAKTLEPSEVNLELLTMRHEFNFEKFWNEILNVNREQTQTEELCQDVEGLVERLSNSIVHRYTSLKCKLFPFGNDFSRHLQCRRVNFIRRAKLYNNSKVSRDGRLLLRKQRDGGRIPHFAINLETTRIECDLKDKYDVYGNDLPLGLHLQYVSDRQTIVGVNVGSPSLLMVDPKEDLNDYYENIWDYCVNYDKVLVCIKKFRHPCPIRYVELIPKFANDQKMFLVKNMPFVEQLQLHNRRVLIDRSHDRPASGKQTEAISALISKLTFEYEPHMLPNPSYSKKKEYVKAKLLDTPYEEPEDITANLDEMHDHIKKELAAVKEMFDFDTVTGGGKRKGGGGSRATGSKRGRK